MNYLYQYHGRLRRIERMAPSIAAVVWKIYQIARPSINLVREITFHYNGSTFISRYNRTGRGHFEIVEIVEYKYERTVCTISNLVEALTLDLKHVLHQKQNKPVLNEVSVSEEYNVPEKHPTDPLGFI
jgi:hypothetical protein